MPKTETTVADQLPRHAVSEFTQAARAILHLPVQFVIEDRPNAVQRPNQSAPDNQGAQQYPTPYSQLIMTCDRPLTFGERAQLLELTRCLGRKIIALEAVRTRNRQMSSHLDAAVAMLDPELDPSDDLSAFLSFLNETGHYVLLKNDEEIVNTGIKPQHTDAMRKHLEKSPRWTLQSNYGYTFGFTDPPYTLLVLTPAPVDPSLEDILCATVKLISTRERARKHFQELKQIEDEYQSLTHNHSTGSGEVDLQSRYDQLKEQMKRTLKLAITDSMTQCFNRRKMEELLDLQASRFRQTQNPFSILMIDIDHFKQINDTFGHDAGDRVLVNVSRTLRNALREQDKVSRWGGEEFIVILPGTPGNAAEKLADRLRSTVEKQPMGIPKTVTVSMGVAEYTEGSTISSLLKAADQALYEAKAAGRNKVVAFLADQG